ncbi:MAG: hypothetical protein WC738_01900 [Candidatus Omnitrophota bacterium]|jgi:hypothetical protein
MKSCIRIAVVVLIASLFTIPAFSQNDKQETGKSQEAGKPVEVAAPKEQAVPAPVLPGTDAENTLQTTQPEEMSIYGEVKSLDDATNSIKLQYYDYDNDEEKTADIILEKDTKMENAQSLHDIRVGDWIDAIYVTKNGKDIARSVIVEKEEEEIPVKADVNTNEKPQEAAPKE